MQMLSEDDLSLGGMTREELDAAWDLWFDLAQSTNELDPSHNHGVFVPIHPAPAADRSALRAPHIGSPRRVE